MPVDLIFVVGVLSVVAQYCAMLLLTICIVSFLSSDSMRVMFIGFSYLFPSLVIQLVIAGFLYSLPGTAWEVHVHSQIARIILASSTYHFLSILLIVVIYSRRIFSRIVYTAMRIRERGQRNQKNK